MKILSHKCPRCNTELNHYRNAVVCPKCGYKEKRDIKTKVRKLKAVKRHS